MGTTGSSDEGKLNTALPDIIARVREYASVPLAVGFGVATRQHFERVAEAGADGVVIGSRLVSVIKNSPSEELAKNVENYCREISLKGQAGQTSLHTPTGNPKSVPVFNVNREGPAPSHTVSDPSVLPPRFGQFGGQYVPESLFDCLIELEEAHKSAMADPEFWKELRSFYPYMNRPSNLYKAGRLTEHAGGATIWLKREDL
jgi:tryptophan synthase